METKAAESKVEAHMAQFESAVNHLIDKVEDTQATVQARIDQAVETVQKPIEFVREVRALGLELADKGSTRVRDLAARVYAKPESYISWAALALGLYVCYRVIRNDRRLRARHRPQISSV